MTLLHPTPTPLPLSTAMRHGSRAEHAAAEGTAFMARLVGGRLDAAGHAAHLRALRAVYDALETTVRTVLHHPAVAAVHDPALDRVPAIDADLDHWAPGAPRATDSPAALRLAARVRALAHDPLLLVAHHYTRYLGDLSGGQAIGRVLEREHGLSGAGTAFYAFPGLEPKRFKDGYRARLDALSLDPHDVERVVAEVVVAFGLNHAVLAELGERLGPAGVGRA